MVRMFKYLSVAVVAMLISGPEAQAKVVGEEVKYTIDGQEFTGYMAYDDALSTKRPGILVVHEWWGHNSYARTRADMLAALGYTAFALDMYGTGKVTDHPKDAKGFMMETMKNITVAEKRFDVALDLLKSQGMVDPSKTAAIGYCFGGGVVLHMARTGRDLDGVVSYHGSLKAMSPIAEGGIKPAIRVFTGAADPMVGSEQEAAFKTEMTAAGVDYMLTSYPGVQHSFTNPEADMFAAKYKMPVGYDAMADADSWAKTRAFFDDIFAK